MSYRIISIFCNNFYSMIGLICRRCTHNQRHFISHCRKQFSAECLLLDVLNCMAHQFHQRIVIRILSLMIRNSSHKRRVLCNMPSNVNNAFYIAVIVISLHICFVNTLAHRRLKIMRKQKHQQMKQRIVLICIRHQID